jgi:hypothetical protein
MMKHNSIALVLALAAALALAKHVSAAIIYDTIGADYSQTFDTLPNAPTNVNLETQTVPKKWIDDTGAPTANQISIVGWHLWHPAENPGTTPEGGTNGHQRFRITSGNSTTGSFYSFGTNNTTDRALGALNSNTQAPIGEYLFTGASLLNDTDRRLTSFSLSYWGEQWRDGGAATPNAQALSFEYSFNATSVQDPAATWHAVSALDFVSPTFANTGGGATLVGNDAANRTFKSVSDLDFAGTGWGDGTTLWLRWKDLSDSGNDHALAVDDLTFSADIPEPASLLLLALGLIGACFARHTR